MKKALVVTIKNYWGATQGTLIFKDRIDFWNYLSQHEIKLQKETTYNQGLHQTLGKNGFYKVLKSKSYNLIEANNGDRWFVSNLEDVVGSWEMI